MNPTQGTTQQAEQLLDVASSLWTDTQKTSIYAWQSSLPSKARHETVPRKDCGKTLMKNAAELKRLGGSLRRYDVSRDVCERLDVCSGWLAEASGHARWMGEKNKSFDARWPGRLVDAVDAVDAAITCLVGAERIPGVSGVGGLPDLPAVPVIGVAARSASAAPTAVADAPAAAPSSEDATTRLPACKVAIAPRQPLDRRELIQAFVDLQKVLIQHRAAVFVYSQQGGRDHKSKGYYSTIPDRPFWEAASCAAKRANALAREFRELVPGEKKLADRLDAAALRMGGLVGRIGDFGRDGIGFGPCWGPSYDEDIGALRDAICYLIEHPRLRHPPRGKASASALPPLPPPSAPSLPEAVPVPIPVSIYEGPLVEAKVASGDR